MTERRELPSLGPRGSLRGMALFVVLAVLTILSIFAVAFVALSNLEITTSQVTSHGMQSDALARSGIEHAKCLLWYDARHDRPGADAPSDIWSSAFQAPLPGVRPDADADLIPNNGPNGEGNDATWLAVRDAAGALIGRYAVAVQDEASKININTACLIPPLKPNQGLSPRELLLGDGGARGIPVGRDALIRLLKERFGPNRVPGARGDDNGNNGFLMADGLDNNANGVIDELDEGIDEYDEYVPSQPFGDDRAFSSMAEAWMAMAPGVPPERPAPRPHAPARHHRLA